MTIRGLALFVAAAGATDPPPVPDALIERIAFGSCQHQLKASPALAAAAASRRPVAFVRWGHELARVPTEELLRRGVARLCATGRYVPAPVVAAFVKRADDLLARSDDGDPVRLARLAGFEMDAATRLVEQAAKPERRGAPERRGGGRGGPSGAPRRGARPRNSPQARS